MRSNRVTGIDINALHLNRIMYVAFNCTTLASRKSSIAIFVDNEAMCCFIASSVKCRMLKKSPKHVNCGMLITKRVYVACFSLYSYFIVLWRDCILFTVTTGTVQWPVTFHVMFSHKKIFNCTHGRDTINNSFHI